MKPHIPSLLILLAALAGVPTSLAQIPAGYQIPNLPVNPGAPPASAAMLQSWIVRVPGWSGAVRVEFHTAERDAALSRQEDFTAEGTVQLIDEANRAMPTQPHFTWPTHSPQQLMAWAADPASLEERTKNWSHTLTYTYVSRGLTATESGTRRCQFTETKPGRFTLGLDQAGTLKAEIAVAGAIPYTCVNTDASGEQRDDNEWQPFSITLRLPLPDSRGPIRHVEELELNAWPGKAKVTIDLSPVGY